MAYKDRDAVVGDLGKRATDRLKVVGSSPILIDGRVRGFWKRQIGTSRVRVVSELSSRVTGVERRAVHEAAARYARFLGLELDE